MKYACLCSVSSAYLTPGVWANVFTLENSMRAVNAAFLYYKSSGTIPLI